VDDEDVVYFFFGFTIMKFLAPTAGITMTFVVILAATITLLQVYIDLDLKAVNDRLSKGGAAGGEGDGFFE
jgi:hypothetical protein